ncbi:hypothetical protein LTR84_008986 [Exophiala bonariae]|uniref:Uncharacterized protein n=1 Tax=Exophiala bonariae TaxID=1690606 RepID=A0AAV9MW14_9EURO|nr:hypothetical protein LTR84_008986 [Exophiala bonariae]
MDKELTEEEKKDFRKDWAPKIRPLARPVDNAEEQRRNRAAVILDNYQELMRYALANEQSIPATRVYFQKVAAGGSPAPIIKDWFKIAS